MYIANTPELRLLENPSYVQSPQTSAISTITKVVGKDFGESFHSNVTHINAVHISLAKSNCLVTSNWKVAEKCNIV